MDAMVFKNRQPEGMLIFYGVRGGCPRQVRTASEVFGKRIADFFRRFFRSAELIRRSGSDCPSPRQSPHFTE
ncbi:hypothetical protein BFP46_24910 [Bacillus licheniformis]|nr:hypothetical protein BFP46_24910 [Bacillus licheniformis]